MKELLFSLTAKDFEWSTFTSGGPGGQNRNKVATGVRVFHRPSGASGESREYRSQYHNKKLALKKLAESIKFKWWVKSLYDEVMKVPIEKKVDEQMQPQNIKVEVVNKEGKWVEE